LQSKSEMKRLAIQRRRRDDLPSLEEDELLALKMAASGHVSSPLGEWPILARTFNKFGLNLASNTGLTVIKKIAKELYAKVQFG